MLDIENVVISFRSGFFQIRFLSDPVKAQPLIRADEDWDVTEKVSREGRKIIQEMIDNEEITQRYGKHLKPNDC